ncbi:MAG: DNA polymerase, partial [archaeon]|nr:DNA polymerase [archaeon]
WALDLSPSGRPIGVIIASQPEQLFYLQLADSVNRNSRNWIVLRERLQRATGFQIVSHSAEQLSVLTEESLLFSDRIQDPMVAAWMLGFVQGTAELRLNQVVERLIPSKLLPLVAAPPYLAMERAYYSLLVMPRLELELKRQHLWQPFCDVDMPLQSVLAEMMRVGFSIDRPLLSATLASIESASQQLRQQILSAAGVPADLDSARGIRRLLVQFVPPEVLGTVTEDRGAVAINKNTLRALASHHPAISLIIRLRSLQAIAPQAEKIFALSSNSGRVHSVFSSCRHANGRLVSEEPNLMGVPNDYEAVGMRLSLRTAFVPAPEHLLACFDYAQIELRLMAHFSGDRALRDSLTGPGDVFANLAGCWLQKSSQDVSQAERRTVKQLVYGIAYGMGSKALAAQLHVGLSEAIALRTRFAEDFAGLKSWAEQVQREAHTSGWVITLGGRKRFFPQDFSSREQLARQAVNAKCQGSAADIVKSAMVAVKRKFPNLHLLLQMHDELIFEIPSSKLSICRDIIQEMEAPFRQQLAVPLSVVLKVGVNWSNAALHQQQL